MLQYQRFCQNWMVSSHSKDNVLLTRVYLNTGSQWIVLPRTGLTSSDKCDCFFLNVINVSISQLPGFASPLQTISMDLSPVFIKKKLKGFL